MDIDDEKAVRFYTEVLSFANEAAFSNRPFRWLTVASAEEPDGTELQLGPARNAYQSALFQRASQPHVLE